MQEENRQSVQQELQRTCYHILEQISKVRAEMHKELEELKQQYTIQKDQYQRFISKLCRDTSFTGFPYTVSGFDTEEILENLLLIAENNGNNEYETIYKTHQLHTLELYEEYLIFKNKKEIITITETMIRNLLQTINKYPDEKLYTISIVMSKESSKNKKLTCNIRDSQSLQKMLDLLNWSAYITPNNGNDANISPNP